MNQLNFRSYLVMGVFAFSLSATSCKNKAKNTTPGPDTVSTVSPAPVEISSDEALSKNVTDATKDYPGVQATVTNGEVTLTGNIERDRLPKLMAAVQGLNPKKVNNYLEVK